MKNKVHVRLPRRHYSAAQRVIRAVAGELLAQDEEGPREVRRSSPITSAMYRDMAWALYMALGPDEYNDWLHSDRESRSLEDRTEAKLLEVMGYPQ